MSLIRAMVLMSLAVGCVEKEQEHDDVECVDYTGEDCASVGLPDENFRAICGDCSELWYCYDEELFKFNMRCQECITEDGYLDTTPGGPCDESIQSPD